MSARGLIAAAAALAVTSTACGSVGRFKDQPVVWRVDDARNIPEPDEDGGIAFLEDAMNSALLRRLPRALELRDGEPAHNTNALDEVPDSTWFENRIGRHDLTPAELARGPNPEPPRMPMTITKGKSKGKNVGFFAKDAAGRKFLVKFDMPNRPEMQTAAAAIGSRFFWAIGYHVPAENVFVLRREDIRIDKKATYTTPAKKKRPVTDAVVDAALARVARRPDGSYRALASEMLPGEAKGSWLPEGVRKDDPNDVVDHEHRREVRGLRVFAAWLGHTDISEGNTLDLYIGDKGRRFLRHHLVDFGEAFGGYGAVWNREADGFEHWVDWANQTKALFAFGLWQRPWEKRRLPPYPSIGFYSADGFDPDEYREAYPFFPFFEFEPTDAFWGAKILVRFTRAHIEAAVASGKLSNPAAAAYLVETIWRRQQIIAAAYLDALTPLDELFAGPSYVCAVDLVVRHRYAPGGVLEVREKGGPVTERVRTDAGGRVCFPTARDETYRVYEVRMIRPDGARPPMQIHMKGGPRSRILGIVR
jgi:hypothetical protein